MHFIKLLNVLFFGPNKTESKNCIISSSKKDEKFEEVGAEIQKVIKNLYGGKSLRIRAVDGGSNNGEEIELTALGNAYYDIERFGLSFVASPRHADMLFVTGPVTRNLETAVRTTYEATPKPCIVVAVGDGACTGGIWNDSYAVVGAVDKVIPVDVRIPGDPPTPTVILQNILNILLKIENNKK